MTLPRDLRPFIYGGLNILFAVAYAVILSSVLHTRHATGKILLWSLVVAMVGLAAGTLSRHRIGRRVAIGCAIALLAATALLLAGLVSSAAFLSGVYGAFGKAASTFTLIAAALIIEAVGLLPAFQLKYLMTRAGKRAYGVSVTTPRPKAGDKAAGKADTKAKSKSAKKAQPA